MNLFDAYPDKKENMIKTYNNMEPYLKTLMETGRNVELPIKMIDGICVDVKLCACTHFNSENNSSNALIIFIECNRSTQVLYSKQFHYIPNFIVWLCTEYHHLSYNKLADRFCPDTSDNIEYNIIKHFPENEKVKMEFEECCVCLSPTRATLPCDHYLCKQCEGSIKIPKCPICREYYEHSDDE